MYPNPTALPPTVGALLFDLDGTLADTAPAIAVAVSSVLQIDGRAPLDVAAVTAMIGDGAPMLLRRAYAATGGPLPDLLEPARLAAFVEALEMAEAARARLYPGVAETLAALHAAGLAMAIVTNKPERPARALVDRLGLAPMIRTLVGGDSGPTRKPDAGPVRAALAALGPDAKAGAVFVGDNAVDVGAARAAGLPVICVTYGYPRMDPAALGADRVIDRFDALPAVLRSPGGAITPIE